MKIFLLCLFLSISFNLLALDLNSTTNSGQQAYDHAQSIYSILEKNSRIITSFNPNIPVKMPIGISKSFGNYKIVIALDTVEYTSEGGRLSAYLLAKFPLAIDSLGFYSHGMSFNKGGIVNGKLNLMGDKSMKLFQNVADLTVADESYVSFDCNGYNGADLKCNIEFDNQTIRPLEDSNGKVSCSFGFKTDKAFDNFMVQDIELSSAFQLSSLNGFSFSGQKFAVDFSDNENPGGKFPAKENSWKGFYAESATISFPPEFKNDQGSQIVLNLSDFMIDRNGVSGSVEATDLVTKGDLGGWEYSITRAKIVLANSSPQEFEMEGTITIPMFDNNTKFSYVAQIDDGGDMVFNVKLEEDKVYKLTALSSDLTLFRNSYIEVKREAGKISPKAVFNGQLSVQAGVGNIHVANVVFSNMVITANPFSFSIEKFALRGKTQSLMSGFPISFKDIGLVKNGNNIGLDFNVLLNFAPEADKGFSADAGFTILSDLKLENGKLTGFNTASLDFKSIYVSADLGFLNFKGEVKNFNQDEKYGNGFRGMLEANFKPGIGVKATAYFGKVNDYRYWYVDALLTLSTPIMVFPQFGIYGFGGGAYYHMRKSGADVELPATATDQTSLDVSNTGNSQSGAIYEPDKNIVFGCKATIEVGTVSTRKAFNGNGTLEFSFNKTSLDKVGIYANAYFITDYDKRDKASVYAKLNAELNITEWSFTASLKTFVDIEGILQGVNTDKSAGTAYMHFSKEKWYVYIGQPSDRIGIKFSILGDAKVSSYFVIGSEIPSMPSLSEILPEYHGELSQTDQRDLGSINGGSGFGFGSKLEVHLGYTLWRISIDGSLLLGFDVMLKNFGKSTHCEGYTSTVGMNGWYAMGDAYAYASGSLAFDAGYLGTYDLVSLSAWVILLAELPNPTYFAGTVGVEYDIVGFSGTYEFVLEKGDKCTVQGQRDIAQSPIIKSVEPKTGQEQVSVAKDLVVKFNVPVEKEFKSSGTYFMISLTEIKLYQGQDSIKCTTSWDEENKILTIKPEKLLNENTSYKLSVIVAPKYRRRNSQIWLSVIDNNIEVKESKEVEFRTKEEAKLQILPENIANSYPRPLQANLYRGITNAGYLSLATPQPELLKAPSYFSDSWKKIVRYTPFNGTPQTVNALIDGEGKSFAFSLENLEKNTIYKFEIVYTEYSISPGTQAKEVVIYTTWFKTSSYENIQEKIEAFTNDFTYQKDVDYKSYVLKETFKSIETFDKYEIGSNAPMLTCTFDTASDQWFQDLKTLFYDKYGPAGPKYKDIPFEAEGGIQSMSEADARLGVYTFKNPSVSISFHGDYTSYGDYQNAQAIAISNTGNPLPDYIHIGKSGHKVIFKYTLPGKSTPVSTFTYYLK